MAVLALDLATVTGWAIHKEGEPRPYYGSFTLPASPNEVGPPMERLRLFLAEKHRIWGLTDIVFEAQHISPKMSIAGTMKLIALGAMVEWFAHKIDAKCYDVHISTWRKHFIGGGGHRRDEAKAKCLAVCQRLGWSTLEVDAAEACGILDYYLSLKPNYERPWRDRLFMGGGIEN